MKNKEQQKIDNIYKSLLEGTRQRQQQLHQQENVAVQPPLQPPQAEVAVQLVPQPHPPQPEPQPPVQPPPTPLVVQSPPAAPPTPPAGQSQPVQEPPPPPPARPRPKLNQDIDWNSPDILPPGVTQRRRRTLFYKVVLSFVLVITLCIFAGAYFLWGYLAAYEASLTDPILMEQLENIDYRFWEQKVSDALTTQLTEFQADDADNVLKPYLAMVRDADYTILQKRSESTGETQVYVLRAGTRDIGIIRLVSTHDAGYGLSLWEIGSVEYLDTFTEGFAGSVRITASLNAQVSINDIPVSDDYSVHCDDEYGKSYQIDNIFGEVEVSVTEWDGHTSEPYYAENGEYLYTILRPFSKSFDIIAPAGVDVFIDGEQIPSEDITEDRIVPSVFAGYLESSEVPLHSVRYELELDGFFSEPEVTAADTQDRELSRRVTADGQIIYSLAWNLEYKELYEGTVEDFIRAYITYNANIGGDEAPDNLTELSKHIAKDSDLYRQIHSSTESGDDWSDVSSVRYNELSIDNFMPYGEKYFTCEIRYSLTNQTPDESREVTGSFEVLFVLTDSKWLAVNMVDIE